MADKVINNNKSGRREKQQSKLPGKGHKSIRLSKHVEKRRYAKRFSTEITPSMTTKQGVILGVFRTSI